MKHRLTYFSWNICGSNVINSVILSQVLWLFQYQSETLFFFFACQDIGCAAVCSLDNKILNVSSFYCFAELFSTAKSIEFKRSNRDRSFDFFGLGGLLVLVSYYNVTPVFSWLLDLVPVAHQGPDFKRIISHMACQKREKIAVTRPSIW